MIGRWIEAVEAIQKVCNNEVFPRPKTERLLDAALLDFFSAISLAKVTSLLTQIEATRVEEISWLIIVKEVICANVALTEDSLAAILKSDYYKEDLHLAAWLDVAIASGILRREESSVECLINELWVRRRIDVSNFLIPNLSELII